MAMKKKFLGLAMAAAMVLPASSAYAAQQTIEGVDGRELNHTIPMTGEVYTSEDLVEEGKIQVELPTAMAFTVNKDSKVSGASYDITNRSQKPIEVIASQFTVKSGDIKVKTQSELAGDISLGENATLNRSNVSLQLVGNDGSNKTEVDLGGIINTVGNDVVSKVASGQTQQVNLVGQAGIAKDATGVDENGANGEFSLTFKIKTVNS